MTESRHQDLDSETEQIRIITTLRWTCATPSSYARSSSESDQLRVHLDRTSIPHHRQRLLEAAEAFGWEQPSDFLRNERCEAELISKLNQHANDQQNARGTIVLKIRISISSTNTMSIDSSPIVVTNASITSLYPFAFPPTLPPRPDTDINCTVYLASTPLKPSIFTKHKTTHRQHYNKLREAAHIAHLSPTMAEVLLFNRTNEITEASLSTVYFIRGNHLITPSAQSGGHHGVSKRIALEDSRCQEGVISRSDLVEGEVVWLSNAVRGFWPARLSLKTKHDES